MAVVVGRVNSKANGWSAAAARKSLLTPYPPGGLGRGGQSEAMEAPDAWRREKEGETAVDIKSKTTTKTSERFPPARGRTGPRSMPAPHYLAV